MPPAPDASPPALRPRRRLSDPSQREASPSTSGSSGSSGSGTVGGSTGSGLAAPEVPWDEVIRVSYHKGSARLHACGFYVCMLRIHHYCTHTT